MFRRTRIMFLALTALYLMSVPSALAKDADLFSLVPKDAMAVISVNNFESDAGLMYILKLWRTEIDRKISLGIQDYRKRRYIDQISYTVAPQQVIAAFFKGKEGEKHQPYVLIIRVTKQDNQMSTLKDAVEKLIKKKLEALKQTYAGREITYSLDRYPKELSAFAILGDEMVIGTNVNLVKKIIDISLNKGETILKNEEFIKLRDKYAKEGDIFIYADNRDKGFSSALKKWEEKNGMQLLLSAGELDNLGISLDLVNDNAVRASVVFKGKAKEAGAKIRDDLAFLNEIVKRKLRAENVVYEDEIRTEDGFAVLGMELKDTKGFWQKVFGPRAKEFLAKSKSPFAAASSGAGTGNIAVKVFIGVIAVVFFVLILRSLETEKDEK